MMRLLLHKLGQLMFLGARTMVQIGMTLFLTKQLILRDWFEKAHRIAPMYRHDLISGKYRLPREGAVKRTDGSSCGFDAQTHIGEESLEPLHQPA
jgi:hypothetical protein